MFSGIIEKLARVTLVMQRGGSLEIELESGWPDQSLGESVAVNGVCLTVTQCDATGRARFFISPETLARTTLGGLAVGQHANLERAVTLDTRLSGLQTTRVLPRPSGKSACLHWSRSGMFSITCPPPPFWIVATGL